MGVPDDNQAAVLTRLPCVENDANDDEKFCRNVDSDALLLSPPSALTIELNALCNSLNWLLETALLELESEESALISVDKSFFIGLSDSDDEFEDSPTLCNVSISVCRNVATASLALAEVVSEVLLVESVDDVVALVCVVLLPNVIPIADKALVSAANSPPSSLFPGLR
ncbi:hypothetical protein [Dickeya lacustris]|uniref:Uncharacterized protein n=1 Tax=Dickeya lacustris TaxID=2259638 RepID=A0ABY8G7L8_9GAMM|nr:hypothetical protein [Dickeya lacustris]WFN55947.1 hypothetical protein O1Q98_01035 [Dickeya lacustris]